MLGQQNDVRMWPLGLNLNPSRGTWQSNAHTTLPQTSGQDVDFGAGRQYDRSRLIAHDLQPRRERVHVADPNAAVTRGDRSRRLWCWLPCWVISIASAPMLDELDLGHAILTTVRERVVVDLCGFTRVSTRTSGS